MSNYFTQLISSITHLNEDTNLSTYVQADHQSVAKINYITIYNPDFVGEKDESREALQKQVLCFVTPNQPVTVDTSADDAASKDLEHINIIGLLRGITSLAQAFHSCDQNHVSVIQGSKSTTLIKQLAPGYNLACSVSLPSSLGTKNGIIINQLSSVLSRASRYFFLLNSSFERLLSILKIEDITHILEEYWRGFLDAYNSEFFEFPPDLKWTNTLNYAGFLGIFHPEKHGSARSTYKASSIALSQAAANEIVETVTGTSKTEFRESIPKGIIISYFDKLSPKKYGLVFKSTLNESYADSQEVNAHLLDDFLVDIYGWLEYHDYHGKLDPQNLTSSKSRGRFFSSSEGIKKKISAPLTISSPNIASENVSDYGFKINPVAALELLNPISLTNNLVISPLNYTMNSVINLGDSIVKGDPAQASAQDSVETESNIDTRESSRANWMSLPYYLNPFAASDGNSRDGEGPTNGQSSNTSEDDTPGSDHDEANHGNYLIGLHQDSDSGEEFIFSRPVYLNTKVEKNSTSKEVEYSLVVYCKDNVYTTLIYDSAFVGLGEASFYKSLTQQVLEPVTDTISNFVLGGSIMGNSIGSLKEMLNGKKSNDSENDFFYVTYNEVDNSIQSSLPYLPIPSISEAPDQAVNKVALKYENAIFHLHDQLIDLFISRNVNVFFKSDSSMNEYLHKFNSNKANDWMFYYIKYSNRCIIIIKNRHHNKKKHTSRGTRPNSLIPPSTLEQGNEVSDRYFLNNIAGNVVNLGFLDNLGDDVKLWLEGFRANPET